ncbi:hypothetical protein RBWH47_01642 [Rhodopirellula baltica WH47]|uniref:Uncharacterized protein n=1 Tax=Rhodopirellula baltica WH47 TaxID=991778 RepID=F2ALZ8_RHOBT|nr:hypothetical protein RBWH47_01642 [Rhodopirellula baltica WH47]
MSDVELFRAIRGNVWQTFQVLGWILAGGWFNSFADSESLAGM